MKEFVPNDYPTVGVEQEFHLIDPQTAELAPKVDEVFEHLGPELRRSVSYELYYSVIEHQSAVCRSVDELAGHIVQARRAIAGACAKAGVRLAAAASHPFSDWRSQPIVGTSHYKWVAAECAYAARRMVAFGLHVHVGMPDAASAFYAMYEMRRWMYPLLALSVNSPYFEGRPTGLASTRTHLFGSMPRTGAPPEFADMAELERFYEKLLATGDVTAPGDLWWSIRPQPPLGTVELRVLDLPTEVRRIAALTAVVQAAMALYQENFRRKLPPARLRPEYIEQNRWKAMRYGIEGSMIDPLTGQVLSTRERLEMLFEMVAQQADRLGSAAHLEFARQMLRLPTEARWQLDTAERLGGDLRALELEIARRTLEA